MEKREKTKAEKTASEFEEEPELSDKKSGEIEIPVEGDDDGVEADSSASYEEEKSPADEAGDELAQLKARVETLEEDKLRAMADLDNYRKRMARQFEEVVRSANDKLLIDLLEVIDNFERALDHGAQETESSDELGAFRDGMAMIYQQMLALLARYDVRPIESLGKPFDPAFHEAMMQVASDEYDEGVIVTEVSKGYMHGDRVLRYARVGVSKGSAE